MLSQYYDLLDKRRLQRKLGNNPLPEIPPFKVLSKEQYDENIPSSTASSPQSYGFREPIILSIAGTPSPRSSRRILTPPPIADSIASTMEINRNHTGSVDRPSYLSYLTPFSVTPRKRMYANAIVTADQTGMDENISNKRVQLRSIEIERDTSQGGFPAQSPDPQSIRNDYSISDQTISTKNQDNADTEMSDVIVNNEIPDKQHVDTSAVIKNTPGNLSIYDLSIHDDAREDDHMSTLPLLPKSPVAQSPNPTLNIDQNAAKFVASEEETRESTEPRIASENDDRISEEPVAQEQPIQYGFDDDNIDYGDLDDNNYDGEPNIIEPVNHSEDKVKYTKGKVDDTESMVNVAERIVNDTENTANDVLKELRIMATADTLSLRKGKNLANLHIKTISNLVLDRMKETRSQTSDPHEQSIIEDYYYTLNDDLKKYYRNYLQYQQLASAGRRLTNFHRKKDLHFLATLKEEGSLKRNIAGLKEEISELYCKLNAQSSVENIFNDIHQIKDLQHHRHETHKSPLQ